ncbi:MAG: sigma-E factor negative regulatory protein, partial [Gammaproteobacteria bacterium]
MSEQNHEALSALMDGELDSGEPDVIGGLIRNDSARRVWHRYHLISDCLKGILPAQLDLSLDERISLALRNEPTLLAPEYSMVRSMLRPLVGFAVAASVAALALLGIHFQRSGDRIEPAASVASVPSSGAAAPANAGITLASGTSGLGSARPSVHPAYASARLNRYLVNYSEYHSG